MTAGRCSEVGLSAGFWQHPSGATSPINSFRLVIRELFFCRQWHHAILTHESGIVGIFEICTSRAYQYESTPTFSLLEPVGFFQARLTHLMPRGDESKTRITVFSSRSVKIAAPWGRVDLSEVAPGYAHSGFAVVVKMEPLQPAIVCDFSASPEVTTGHGNKWR